MTKKDALNALSQTADLLELLGGNDFRAAAYRKSERLLERWEGNWDAAIDDGFKDAPGVSVQTGRNLVQYAQTGAFQPLEELRLSVPSSVVDLFRVRGLGPKKIRALWDAGVDSIFALVASAKAGELSGFKGFGKSTQDKLLEAITATKANVGFDAIGGGRLTGQLLSAMEQVASAGAAYSRYGSSSPKQVYIYGALDLGPTILNRNFGLTWSVSGWLLTPFLAAIGQQGAERLRQRVRDGLTTTFASNYKAKVPLREILSKEAVAEYNARRTGEKYLILPNG